MMGWVVPTVGPSRFLLHSYPHRSMQRIIDLYGFHAQVLYIWFQLCLAQLGHLNSQETRTRGESGEDIYSLTLSSMQKSHRTFAVSIR